MSPPSPAPSGWPLYTDTTYHFTVSYPPNFTFQLEHGLDGTGLLMAYRTFDPIYANTYPPGQISIGIYSRDADTLRSWVAKHSGPSSSTDITRYWKPVSNETDVAVGSRGGLSFDWVGDQGGITIHETIMFMGASYVFAIDWYATDSTYADVVQRNYQQMLDSLRT